MPSSPDILNGSTSLHRHDRVTGIDATGELVAPRNTARLVLSIQNVGTVALEVHYTADGTGEPVKILQPGSAADDGTGGDWTDALWNGPVWLKAPDTAGAALVSEY